MTKIHFENIWEKSEELNKDSDQETLIDEIIMKLNLYKLLVTSEKVEPEKLKELQIQTFGEILFSLTGLSLKDNIDVAQALSQVIKYRQIGMYSNKHS